MSVRASRQQDREGKEEEEEEEEEEEVCLPSFNESAPMMSPATNSAIFATPASQQVNQCVVVWLLFLLLLQVIARILCSLY